MDNIKKTERKGVPIHIGSQIDYLLNQQRITKCELGKRIGVSASNAVHLTTRDNVDVRLLQKVGNALKYDFFKHHFPIDDGQKTDADYLAEEKRLSAEKDKQIEELNAKIAALQRETDPLRNEMQILKIENEYLKDFSAFVKAAFGSSPGRRKGLGGRERLMIGEGK